MNMAARKDELKRLSLLHYPKGCFLYQLVNDGTIDNIISKIDDCNVYARVAISKKLDKNFMTGNEHFVEVFIGMLNYFEHNFCTLYMKERYIPLLLNNKSTDFLFSKKYFHDSSNISYYQINMKRFFVENMFNNIKLLYSDFSHFFNKIKIFPEMSLDNAKDIEILFKFLVDLVSCNNDGISVKYIFINFKDFMGNYDSDSIDADNIYKLCYNIYYNNWNNLIDRYLKYIDLISQLKEKN